MRLRNVPPNEKDILRYLVELNTEIIRLSLVLLGKTSFHYFPHMKMHCELSEFEKLLTDTYRHKNLKAILGRLDMLEGPVISKSNRNLKLHKSKSFLIRWAVVIFLILQ